jgi:RNA polymerase sigma-70 factor (ECF subfamily)
MNPPSAPQPYLNQGQAVPVGAEPGRVVESEDEALVRRMADGDDQALGVLYDRWHSVVHGVVGRMLRHAEDVEDVVEETFWQAWRQASRFDRSRGAVQTWLLTIARSRALDRVRALRRRHRDRRGRVGQLPNRVLQRRELALADRAGRDVRHHRAALGRIECVERERFQRLACLVVRHAVAHPDPPPAPSLPSTCSWLRSF